MTAKISCFLSQVSAYMDNANGIICTFAAGRQEFYYLGLPVEILVGVD